MIDHNKFWKYGNTASLQTKECELKSEFIDCLVKEYDQKHREKLAEHLSWYSRCASREEAIGRISRAEVGSSGRRHPHQYRLPIESIEDVEAALSEVFLMDRTFAHFSDLYQAVDLAIRRIDDVGDLMVYDTALRLGAHLCVYPTTVFLQRGP